MNAIQSTLIVDDSESDVYLTRRILRKSGLFTEVLDTGDGEEALDLLIGSGRKGPGTGGKYPPTLILLDINMPRVDGFQFLERLEEIAGDDLPITVVMLSTSDDSRDIERATASRLVKGYIVKPLDMQGAADLVQTLGAVIGLEEDVQQETDPT